MDLRPILERLVRLLPRRVILDRDGRSPYLSRWYVRGRPFMPDGSSPFDATGQMRPEAVFPDGVHLYVHRFHRSDQDVALHNHPWKWARSLILAGGYSEERTTFAVRGLPRTKDLNFGLVERVVRRPGDLVRIDEHDFHRVDLLEHDSWSLFLAGPKTGRSWGFWDRATGEFAHWRDFIARVRGVAWDETKDEAKD
jgi:hypothetical protein